MPSAPDTHSRIVFWLKILLPLGALAILSTLFLFSRDVGPEGLLPISNVDVEEMAREQRITRPHFAGMTSDGAAVTVRAETARPGTEETGGSMERIEAEYAAGDGRTIRLRAELGQIDAATSILHLSGKVLAETSDGYRIETDAIQGRLDRTEVSSPGKVTATAPFGTLTAGAMRLSRSPTDGGMDRMDFNGGVRLIYLPRK